MKLQTLLFVFAVAAISSCSSQRQSAQTTDDLYYSPNSGSRYTAQNSNNSNSDYYNANGSDQYLMMKVQDPNRWSTFDDYGYDAYSSPYSSFGYGMDMGYGMGYYSAFSPWINYGFWDPYFMYMSSYYMWNSFYNPYYYNVVVVSPKYPSYYNAYTGLHPFNVNAYKSGLKNQFNNGYTGRFYTPSANSFSNRRNSNFNPNQRTNNSQNNQQPVRTYSPSNFGGNGGGMRGGGGGGFSRPGRG